MNNKKTKAFILSVLVTGDNKTNKHYAYIDHHGKPHLVNGMARATKFQYVTSARRQERIVRAWLDDALPKQYAYEIKLEEFNITTALHEFIKDNGEYDGVNHIIYFDESFRDFFAGTNTPDLIAIYAGDDGLVSLLAHSKDDNETTFPISIEECKQSGVDKILSYLTKKYNLGITPL